MRDIATMFKALGEETRLRILALLIGGELCVCDLMHVLSMSQSTVSRHLAYLKNAGWVVGRRSGKWMHYRLAVPGDSVQRQVLAALQNSIADIPHASEDRETLVSYLKTKTKRECQ